MKELLHDEYSLIIHGPPGVGKREFCIDLAGYQLGKKSTVLYVTTERAPNSIKEVARNIGAVFVGERLFFVDYASWSTSKKTGWLDDRMKIICLQNPSSLRDISMAVKTISQTSTGRLNVFFDSLSPLFLYNDDEKVVQFIQTLIAQLRSEGGSIAVTLQEGVHPPSTFNSLMYMVDGYIQLRFLDDGGAIKRQLRVHHLHGKRVQPEWRGLEITEKGVEVL